VFEDKAMDKNIEPEDEDEDKKNLSQNQEHPKAATASTHYRQPGFANFRSMCGTTNHHRS